MIQTKTKKFDLTEGSILNKLLVIALPIMGTQLLQMAYNLTDMFWMGRVSSDAVASSGTAGMYLWMSMAFLMIGRMGAEIGVSQNVGRGDREEAMSYSRNAIFLAVVLGVIFAGVMIAFRKPLIGFFCIKERSVAKDAMDYLAIVSLGIPASFVSGAVNGTFTGAGNSKAPFYLNAIGLVVNMILDPLLIFRMDMGISGAAIATVLAQLFVCIMFIAAITLSRNRPFDSYKIRTVFKPDQRRVKQIFKWSIPIAMESLFFTFLSMIMSRFVAAYGAGAIAVQRVGSQVESLSWLIGGGFSSALTAYMGQNYGAEKWERIHRGFQISAILMVSYGIMITAIMFFGAKNLFMIFIPDQELTDMGISYLKILSVSQLATCMEALAGGTFRGIGKTIPPSVISITCNTLRVPLAYMLSQTSLGLDGIWWGMTIGGIFRGFVMLGWYLLSIKKYKLRTVI